MSRNLAASIRARLKQRADATKQDFNLTLTHYGLERLLYRLSISTHAGNYLLKGALLFSLWYDQPHRPTRDAGLLGHEQRRPCGRCATKGAERERLARRSSRCEQLHCTRPSAARLRAWRVTGVAI